MDISIIIPTVNRKNILDETITQLVESCRGIKAEIIVVNDNNSSKVKGKPFEHSIVKVYDNPGTGAASARNLGVKYSSSALLLFLDDDILIKPQHLKRTLSLHSQNLKVAYNFNWKYPEEILQKLNRTKFGRFLVHSNLIDYKGWVRDVEWTEKEMVPVNKLAAFYFSISKDDFIKVGGFNESFTNQGIEDDELSLRLTKNGVKLFIIQTECVLHNEKDRQKLVPKLIRTRSGYLNKRKAFELGMKEYKVNYTTFKKRILPLLVIFKPAFIGLANLLPNIKALDEIYFKIVKLLYAISIYQGYSIDYKQID